MLGTPITVIEAAVEPIDLAVARDFVGAGDDGMDGRLSAAIGMARASLEATTGLRLITQTVDIEANTFAELAHLNVAPVNEIVSIDYLDVAGAEHTIDEERYELFGAGLDRGIRPTAGATWPTVSSRGKAIRVQLTVGFGASGAAVPKDLQWALLTLMRGGIDDQTVDVGPLIANWRLFG